MYTFFYIYPNPKESAYIFFKFLVGIYIFIVLYFRIFTANEERVSCIRALLNEQREISLNAAAHSLSAIHLRQRLYVYQRYFIALTRYRKADLALENARKSPDALVEITNFQVCYKHL